MTIVPRWEWRTFGVSFGPAEERLAASEAGRVEESDEVYLLSLRSDASVKLRGGLLDAKRRLQTDGELEQWMPVFKAGLPLSETDTAALLQLLGVQELSSPDLREVSVRKRRAHYTVGGCMAELTEMRTKEGATRTIAVEATDPALVRAAVRSLGLEAAPAPLCVARGLKALVGWGVRRTAVIDVGTNSVKFQLAQEGADGWQPVVDRAEVTRLGEGLEATGQLGDAPIERTADAVAAMAAEARENGATKIVAVGTAGLRTASNRARFIDAVRQRCGVEVEVISGDEEARLAYLGAMSGLQLPDGAVVVFDSGGGSSQFTFAGERFSLDIGAVRVTERFGLDGPVDLQAIAGARAALEHDLARLKDHPRPDAVVGMGGTVTNLAAVSLQLSPYDPDRIQGTTLGRVEIDRQIELYRARDAAGRRELAGLQPARAEVILAGACIVRTVLELLDAEALTVSDRGLRHGVLIERG